MEGRTQAFNFAQRTKTSIFSSQTAADNRYVAFTYKSLLRITSASDLCIELLGQVCFAMVFHEKRILFFALFWFPIQTF